MPDNQEPGFALKRELNAEARAREKGDAALAKEIKGERRRRRSMTKVARGAAWSVKILAVACVVQVVILLLILTRQWPELWPLILKTVAKLIGG